MAMDSREAAAAGAARPQKRARTESDVDELDAYADREILHDIARYSDRHAHAQQPQNPFEALPDAIIQQVLIQLGPRETYEDWKLPAVDRRFRRVVHAMHWPKLWLQRGDVEEGDESCVEFSRVIGRFASRVRNRTFQGATDVEILPDFPYDAGLDSEEIRDVVNLGTTIIGLLATLTTAPVLLEDVHVDIWEWPSAGKLRMADQLVTQERLGALLFASLSAARQPFSLKVSSEFAEVLTSPEATALVPPLFSLDLSNSNYRTVLKRDNLARSHECNRARAR
eukprot:tig00020964_g16789.t1